MSFTFAHLVLCASSPSTPQLHFSAPMALGPVDWGVSSGKAFDESFQTFGVLAGTVATLDGGKSYTKVAERTIGPHLVACGEGCFHDYGRQIADKTNMSWHSPNATFWRLLPNGTLSASIEKQTVSFTGLPLPSMPSHWTGTNGLRFGGTATVELPPSSTGGRTILQTAIVNWPSRTLPDDNWATSIVMFTSADGFAFKYLSSVAVATDNPSSDEGPNECVSWSRSADLC